MVTSSCLLAYFSPTGTTCKVARAIAEGTGYPIVEMDLSAADCATKVPADSLLIAAIPVYAGRVPAVALERLAKLRGDGQNAVAVAVYGNRAFDDALLELKDALEGIGFQVIAAGAFVAEHSIIRSVAAGRPDHTDLEIARLFGADVAAKLSRTENVLLSVPGKHPYCEVTPSAFHPAAGETCTKCGICAEKCPMGAIPTEDPRQTCNDMCINCMRCVQICPQQCRSLPAPFLAGAAKMLAEKASGYKHPQIFL